MEKESIWDKVIPGIIIIILGFYFHNRFVLHEKKPGKEIPRHVVDQLTGEYRFIPHRTARLEELLDRDQIPTKSIIAFGDFGILENNLNLVSYKKNTLLLALAKSDHDLRDYDSVNYKKFVLRYLSLEPNLDFTDGLGRTALTINTMAGVLLERRANYRKHLAGSNSRSSQQFNFRLFLTKQLLKRSNSIRQLKFSFQYACKGKSVKFAEAFLESGILHHYNESELQLFLKENRIIKPIRDRINLYGVRLLN